MPVTVQWFPPSEGESNVDHYRVYRDTRTATPVEVTDASSRPDADGTAQYSFTDPDGQDGDRYGVKAVSSGGTESALSSDPYAEPLPRTEDLSFSPSSDLEEGDTLTVTAKIRNLVTGTAEAIYDDGSSEIDSVSFTRVSGNSLLGTYEAEFTLEGGSGHRVQSSLRNNGGTDLDTEALPDITSSVVTDPDHAALFPAGDDAAELEVGSYDAEHSHEGESSFWEAGWFYADDVTNWSDLIKNNNTDNGNYAAVWDGDFHAGYYSSGVAYEVTSSDGLPTVAANERYFYYVEHDGGTAFVRLYNADQGTQGEASKSVPWSPRTSAVLRLGWGLGGWQKSVCGGGTPLTSSEIDFLYNGGAPLRHEDLDGDGSTGDDILAKASFFFNLDEISDGSESIDRHCSLGTSRLTDPDHIPSTDITTHS